MRGRFGQNMLRGLISALLSVSTLATFGAPHSNAATTSCGAGTCTVTFDFSGGEETWTVPFTGDFTLEVWGAQGGGGTSYYGNGGAGGYAKGTATLTSGATLYVNVGQVGAISDTQTSFNGGGKGDKAGGNGPGGGGGGATHIATMSGRLSALSASTSNVLIVAGGGGGAGGSTNASWSAYAANGGYGGGASGGAGVNGANEVGTYRAGGGGGTQSTPGAYNGPADPNVTIAAFGKGGNSSTVMNNNISGGGGGGGWYGGGPAPDGGGSGGGGSGYVGTLSNSVLTAGNASMPNPAGGTMTGRTGSGFARITYADLSDSSVSISVSGGATQATYRTAVTITATVSTPGKVTFYSNGKRIPGCISIAASTSVNCSFKPSTRGSQLITASLVPSSGAYRNSKSSSSSIQISNRTSSR